MAIVNINLNGKNKDKKQEGMIKFLRVIMIFLFFNLSYIRLNVAIKKLFHHTIGNFYV